MANSLQSRDSRIVLTAYPASQFPALYASHRCRSARWDKRATPRWFLRLDRRTMCSTPTAADLAVRGLGQRSSSQPLTCCCQILITLAHRLRCKPAFACLGFPGSNERCPRASDARKNIRQCEPHAIWGGGRGDRNRGFRHSWKFDLGLQLASKPTSVPPQRISGNCDERPAIR
jgi:hypothetical protein